MTPTPTRRRDIFLRVAQILQDPKRWTRHASARDQDGLPCGARNPGAASWCVQGAIACIEAHPSELDDAEEALTQRVGRPIQVWNDRSTHRQVMLVLLEMAR